MKQRDMISMLKQRGISKFGFMMLGLILATFFTVGLKVAPLYIDHSLLTDLAEELISNGTANNMTVNEIRERFGNSIRLNGIEGFDINDIRISRVEGNTVISIAYERRVPLVSNLELIATFDDTLR